MNIKKEILEKLLFDNTTKQNIAILNQKILDLDLFSDLSLSNLETRTNKSTSTQKFRTRHNGEVFTPSWICNQINGYIDEDFFQKQNAFNIQKGQVFKSNTQPILLQEKQLQSYISTKILEVSCGEAPFLISRYDTTNGNIIPIECRIGVLDRKLRIINDNINKKDVWYHFVKMAYQNTYGYELQVDNLIIARINLLLSFIEYYKYKWDCIPTNKELEEIINIITWNVWQMDGITNTIPNTKTNCLIYDWTIDKVICFKDINNEKDFVFDYCIGNPPYQKLDGGAQASAMPIYQFFVYQAKQISNHFIYIMPSRWMTGGKGLDSFRYDIIHDKRIKLLYDFINSKYVFPNVEIKGGVCIIHWDKNYNDNCNCYTHKENEVVYSFRPLCDGTDTIFIREHTLVDIKNKVNCKIDNSFSTLISTRNPYGLRADSMRNATRYGLPEFSSIPYDDGFQILGLGEKQHRVWKYIPNDYPLPKNYGLLGYKIFIPEAYGVGKIGECPSNPIVALPKQLCTETFLQVGPFKTTNEAENVLKYIKTKFFRTMVSIKKQTQHTTQKVYQLVPLQDFTNQSDIDWTKDIQNIDKQLFKKYCLSNNEIEFIEKNIKEMK